jgi:hypothetical protein
VREVREEPTHSSVYLGTSIIQVVVVDVELRIRVCGTSSFEGNVNKVFAKNSIENTVSPGSIILEDFVNNILDEWVSKTSRFSR